METLKVTLPSALDAGVDYPKLGELRIKVTTRVANAIVRLNLALALNKTATISIIGNTGAQFCNVDGTTNLGTTINFVAGTNTAYFKAVGTFYLSISDKFAIAQLGDAMLMSTPSNSAIGSPAVYSELDIKDMTYTECIRFSALNAFSGDIAKTPKTIIHFDAARESAAPSLLTGTLSSTTFNYPALFLLNLTYNAIKGSVTGLNFTNARVLRFSNTELTGELVKSNISSNLIEIAVVDTDIKFDLAILSDVASLLNAASLNGSLVYGSISGLSSFTGALSELKGLNLSGDVSRIHNNVYFMSNVNSPNYKNKNSHLSTTYWTNKKADRAYILATESVKLVTGVDQFLIDMAGLELHPSAVSGGSWNRTISIRGTRTAASDAAVTALQNKGVTVVMSTTA